jgi:uncharacterized protein (DUF58 family)
VLVFACSFTFHWFFPIGQSFLLLLCLVTFADGFLIMNKKQAISAVRDVPSVMSLGDENRITITVKNECGINLNITIYDDLPYQVQNRNFKNESPLLKGEEKLFEYVITPKCRGKYDFGNINILITTPLGFVCRKVALEQKKEVHVYPSIVQMKKYELKSASFFSMADGLKRHRRVGHSYEFDQIREYVFGDDSRAVNWKASSRRATLMVNQFEDERSQQVYSIIDKGRTMRMPFNGLTLLDHSINTSLVLSNIILQKHDKAGLITFSDKIGTIIPAEKSDQQIKKILEALYNEQDNFIESEYELLYQLVRRVIKNRSLIFLYTNFESIFAFERVLPILRQINKLHLLVVMIFDNAEVVELSKKSVNKLHDIYVQTLARKYLFDKNQIITELSNHGIHCVKSLPDDLSAYSINKYLELKSRGMA